MLLEWKKKLYSHLFAGLEKLDERKRIDLQDRAQTLLQQGNEALAKGSLPDAVKLFRQALNITPDAPEILMCLGYALKEVGETGEARLMLERGLGLVGQSDLAHEFHYLLGEISAANHEYLEAKARFESALQIRPDFTHACKNLCSVLLASGNSGGVKPFLERMVRLSPKTLDYRLWLADLYEGCLDFEGLARELSAAYSLGMNDATRLSKLGAAYFYLDDATSALNFFRVAVEIDASIAFDKHMAHAGFFMRAGENEQAVVELNKAVEISPASTQVNSMLLMLLSYTTSPNGISYEGAATRFEQFLPKIPPLPKRQVIEGESIRIGFVSADFREHPVAHFLKGVIKNIDQRKFEIFAYSNNGQNDIETKALRKLLPNWRDIQSVSDEAAAQSIRADRIDVLIDLSGHTGGNRLGVFALRPAPTQVSWLGFFASTGLHCVDYILVDAASVPLDTSEWFSEKVYRLPKTRLCMSTPAEAERIPVSLPPHVANGFVTFGSFQQLAKINQDVLGLWLQILSANPSAKLRLQAPGLEKEKTRRYFVQRLTEADIDLARVDLVAPFSFPDYLSAHAHVDVLLDTFPYTGGTTTAFGLWMGVPTITLAGNTMLSRQGVMMMQCVELDQFIASDIEDYLRIASDICIAPQGLTEIRLRMREKLQTTPLFNAKLFTAEFERALVYMQTH